MAREPLYRKAEAEMTRRIRKGIWQPGRRLPNEFVLAEEFGVSQGTMRRALMTLESQGLLDRKPGRGTVVATPRAGAATDRQAATGFDRLEVVEPPQVFRDKGHTRTANETEAALFGPGDVHVITRTLRCAGARFALEEIILPAALAPDIPEGLPAGFVQVLAEYGLHPARMDDRITADLTSMGDAVALSVDRYTPLLCLERVARDTGGRALGRQRLRIAGDAAYGVTLTG